MKVSLRCPKWDGKRIRVLERWRIPGDGAEMFLGLLLALAFLRVVGVIPRL